MAQSILIFDFGKDEEAAQQARHKVEGWSQGFRLGKKILLKFDREESGDAEEAAAVDTEPPSGSAAKKAVKKSGKKAPSAGETGGESGKPEESGERVRVLVKLDFSDHEKLTSQRWLDRIPTEEPFKSAKSETIRQGSAEFAATAKRFDLLT